MILSLPDVFMMVAAINVPLGRAFVEKKKKKSLQATWKGPRVKTPNAGMERGSKVENKKDKIR